MIDTFRVRLYTLQNLSDVEVARTLWRLIDDPLIAPRRFDSIERAKKPFRADAAEDASRLYDEERFLTVLGGRRDFVAVFRAGPRGSSTWSFWLDLVAIETDERTRWLEWLYRLCSALPILFGFGCSTAEYDAKHTYVRETPGGGTVTGEVGTSLAEFFTYLPGMYWVTIFGPQLVSAFGAEKLSSLTDADTVTLEAGQIAIQLKDSVVPETMELRRETERRLALEIGAEFFFDRDQPTSSLKSVPELIEAIEAHEGRTGG